MRLTPEQCELAEDNIRIAYYLAHQYNNNNILDFQELLSIALENLAIAALNFKAKNNAKFSTYAFKVIKYAILLEFKKQRQQQVIQQALFQPYTDITDILEGDLNPQIEAKLQVIIDNLRNFKGTQREKAAVITFIRNPYLTQREIARKTGVNHKTVLIAIKNFKKQLQDAV